MVLMVRNGSYTLCISLAAAYVSASFLPTIIPYLQFPIFFPGTTCLVVLESKHLLAKNLSIAINELSRVFQSIVPLVNNDNKRTNNKQTIPTETKADKSSQCNRQITLAVSAGALRHSMP